MLIYIYIKGIKENNKLILSWSFEVLVKYVKEKKRKVKSRFPPFSLRKSPNKTEVEESCLS